MLWIRTLFVIFFFAFAKAELSYAQSTNTAVEKLQSLPLEVDQFIGVDNFKNTYFVKGTTLHKTGTRSDHQFTALQLGKVTSVDILNPLKITVFYESANTVVILDNTLTEITRVNFSTLENFRNINRATTASDRRIWIFNTDLQQLEIFDYSNLKVITQFPPMKRLPLGQTSNFNFCWILTEDGVYTYNAYGSFLHKRTLEDGVSIAQDNGNLMVKTTNKLVYKPKGIASFEALELPEFPVKQFSLNNEILYIYSGQTMTSYLLKSAKN